LLLLIVASLSIAVIHSLAPDHYIPFAVIGRAMNWRISRILLFSLAAGTIHVASSILLGLLLIKGINALGFAELIESLSPLLLIAVGSIYALFTLLKDHKHVHYASAATILLILGLSPCIPLIPLMLAAKTGLELIAVSLSFSVATVSTIIFMTFVSVRAVKPPKILHGREDFLAGLIIAVTGLLTYLFKLKHESYKA